MFHVPRAGSTGSVLDLLDMLGLLGPLGPLDPLDPLDPLGLLDSLDLLGRLDRMDLLEYLHFVVTAAPTPALVTLDLCVVSNHPEPQTPPSGGVEPSFTEMQLNATF